MKMVLSENQRIIKDGCLMVSYSQIEKYINCPLGWSLAYLDGFKDETPKQATAFGSATHYAIEKFFRSYLMMSAQDMSIEFEIYTIKNPIPWDDIPSMVEAGKDSLKLFKFLEDIKNKKAEEMSPIESLFYNGEPVGIEEKFNIPYKLPEKITINDQEFDTININGFIDLVERVQVKNGYVYFVVDHKSDKKGFYTQDKLDSSLQLPIYNMHILRKYGALAKSSYYFHTRSLKAEKVVVNMDRIKSAVSSLNELFSEMYDDKKIDSYKGCETPKNRIPKPSPLCYWCEHGRMGSNRCKFASNWIPRKKKE